MSRHPTSRIAWLIPRPGESGADLARRTRLRLTTTLVIANALGAAIVFSIGVWVLPPTAGLEDEAAVRLVNLIALVAFFAVITPLTIVRGGRQLRRITGWLVEERPPTEDERRLALQGPRLVVSRTLGIWAVATIAFGTLNATYALESGQRVAISTLLAGLTTGVFAYLLSERQLRPIAARALAGGAGSRRYGPGVKTRAFAAWSLGTAVPIVGLLLVALSTLIEGDFSRDQLAIVVLVVGGLGLVVGMLASILSARAVADPVIALRKAVERVEAGELDAEVEVYDGSEIGQLQAGFNRMTDGLRERERIRDLFGRHVGEDVARAALDADVALGGETREVAVMFTDVVSSTALAAERPATEVVELLNSFFAIVVEVVDRHRGWVNKFEGDAALAVFGAPVALDDAPTRALAAARELAVRLDRELDGISAAIGVSAGEVVAGNIGEERRFEYTVIGDPVNEAARLTELAKSKPGMVLAAASAVEAAVEDEARRWELGEQVELRGRSRPTTLGIPARPA